MALFILRKESEMFEDIDRRVVQQAPIKPLTEDQAMAIVDYLGIPRGASKMESRFIETLLIEIHWNGVRSEHQSDIKWLESRVKQLAGKVAPILAMVRYEAQEDLRKEMNIKNENT